MNHKDAPGRVHWHLYGKSDKLNSPVNQNREFQDGYRAGVESVEIDPAQVLKHEYRLRVEVNDDRKTGFEEWKRGFWAARSQLVAAGIRRRLKRIKI